MTPDALTGGSASSLIARTAQWVETSGRALELRVARVVRKIGAAKVLPSFNYTDVVTGQSRESDVVARFEWISINRTPCSITAAIECKSSTKHPWVAFYSDEPLVPRAELADWATFAHGPLIGIVQSLPDQWVGREPFLNVPVSSHVVAAYAADGKNPAGDAVRQVLSVVSALREKYIRRQSTDRVGLVCVAVVVTSAPLLSCRLDSQGDVKLNTVDRLDVWGYDEKGERQRVYIRSEGALPALVDGLRMRAVNANEEQA